MYIDIIDIFMYCGREVNRLYIFYFDDDDCPYLTFPPEGGDTWGGGGRGYGFGYVSYDSL